MDESNMDEIIRQVLDGEVVTNCEVELAHNHSTWNIIRNPCSKPLPAPNFRSNLFVLDN